VVDRDPHKITDLDNYCEFETADAADIGFDIKTIDPKKADAVEIRNLIERKYPVSVQDIEIVLLPVWDCVLKEKKSGSTRSIRLDALLGREILFNT
jgi:hypothetical protein